SLLSGGFEVEKFNHNDERVGISALAYVFTLHRAEHLDPEQSLLAGLVQNLGLIPILKFIDEHPGLIKKAETLEKSMSNLRMPISALLFEQWNFDSDFLQVVEHAENWNRDTGKPADYADLVIASRLLYLHRAGQLDENIVLNQLPVMKKLNLLDIDNSGMFFFEQAQQEIDDMQKLLRT
ncbi:MAG: HDOD domain-containing protein, partial [Gammaproteobacteria bacterium]